MTFYSYKGGTGRSMALANVAWILASGGARVLAIDWDFEAPGLHRYYRPFLSDPELSETQGLIDFFVHFTEAAHQEAAARREASGDASAALTGDATRGSTAGARAADDCPSPDRRPREDASTARSGSPITGRGAAARGERTSARPSAPTAPATSESARSWFLERADLSRYAVPITHAFDGGGRLDFVGAGQQGASYGARVNAFNWADFYERLGGGTFLEAAKASLRRQYDYVLIDSRTGLSDTSGICTVQMPDDLLVCFTLNRQSIFGAAAVAESADAQRRLSTGVPGLRILPVAMRVELVEKDRLEAARAIARAQFAPFLWHVPRRHRAAYWGDVEVLYFPYYAYEEVLATIADRPGHRASLLDAMQRMAAQVSRGTIREMPAIPESVRAALLARYAPPRDVIAPEKRTATSTRKVFLSYAMRDGSEETVARLASALDQRFGPGTAFWDHEVPFGADWQQSIETALNQSNLLIAVVGTEWRFAQHILREIDHARARSIPVVPVLVNGASAEVLPDHLRRVRYARLRDEQWDQDVDSLLSRLPMPSDRPAEAPTAVDPDDPHRGQFGRSSERNGRRLEGEVTDGGAGWYGLRLSVQAVAGAPPLRGSVTFHMHPTFRPSVLEVPVEHGQAILSVAAWGAFTVGAVADEGQTRLELNLATLPGAPREFRER